MKERCITREVISYFSHNKKLYEDKEYHNAVFVGTDKDGIVRHMHKKGTASNSVYRFTVSGSDPKYSFHHIGKSEVIYVFESPIDMMSYITIRPERWQQHSYVALCGVAECALIHQLKENRHLNIIILCLDNDSAGRKAASRIKSVLEYSGYTRVEEQYSKNKDWNDDLKEQNGKNVIHADTKVSCVKYSFIIEQLFNNLHSTKPPFLIEKVQSSFNRLIYSRESQLSEKCYSLSQFLFVLIKDEYRKSECTVDEEEIKECFLKQVFLIYGHGSLADLIKQLRSSFEALMKTLSPETTLYIAQINSIRDQIAKLIAICIEIIVKVQDRKE